MQDVKVSSSSQIVIRLRPLKHRGKHNIALVFDRNKELEKQVRKLKGATWTRTHRCWFSPLDH